MKTVADISEGNKALNRIVGGRLTSVDFVLDYLILGFDGKGALTTLIWPEVHFCGAVLKFGEPRYRDTLCDLITRVVVETQISDNETMTISFDGAAVIVPLPETELRGERAILTGPQHFLYVW